MRLGWGVVAPADGASSVRTADNTVGYSGAVGATGGKWNATGWRS